MHAVLTLESNSGSSHVPWSISTLRVPLDASPGNASFRTQAASKLYSIKNLLRYLTTPVLILFKTLRQKWRFNCFVKLFISFDCVEYRRSSVVNVF